MKKSSFVCCLIIFCLAFFFLFSSFSPNIAYASHEFSTSAKAMCLMESSTNRVLRSKNEHMRLPMASTTKIMTAITAIEHCKNLDEKFVVSKKAIGVSGTSLYLRDDEELSIRDLLYGLMLVSGNDASVAIGERISGNVEFFVDLMNVTAKKIGAKNTHFENTHGLDEKGHYTSAYDLALISSYALKNPVFKEIVGTKNIKITSGQGKDRYLQNKNKLLRKYEGANGVKTGFTDDAGRCFVGSAERDGMTLVCSVLSCGPMFEDCASLLDEGFKNYKMIDVTERVFRHRRLNVVDGKREFAIISPKEKYYYPMRDYEIDKISFKEKLQDQVKAPMRKGEEVGEIEIFFDNNLIFSLKFTTIEDVDTKGVIERFFDILNRW